MACTCVVGTAGFDKCWCPTYLFCFARLPPKDHGAEVQIVTLILQSHGKVEVASAGSVVGNEQLKPLLTDVHNALENYQQTALR